MNLLIRLLRSTGVRNLEATHLNHIDINPRAKEIMIRQKRLQPVPELHLPGNICYPKTEKGTRNIPIGDALLAELWHQPKDLTFPDKHGKAECHLLRRLLRATEGCGVTNIKMHRYRDTFITN